MKRHACWVLAVLAGGRLVKKQSLRGVQQQLQQSIPRNATCLKLIVYLIKACENLSRN
jgi:hypothetical protein